MMLDERWNIKILLKYHKPMLVYGMYEPPLQQSDTYRCYFRDIHPIIFGARGRYLCHHVQISRDLCEEYYHIRLDNDYKGKLFVLCVHPRLYTGKDGSERGGLELDTSLTDYFPPIQLIPHRPTIKEGNQLYRKVPYGKLLDLRYLPFNEKIKFMRNVEDNRKVGYDASFCQNRNVESYQGSKYFTLVFNRMKELKVARRHPENGALQQPWIARWDDNQNRMEMIMDVVIQHPEWTVGQVKHLVKIADLAKTMQKNGINPDKWCVKHGKHGNGKG